MSDAPVRLGDTYRDSITGFEGVATGRFEYLHGCVRIMLERGDDAGKAEELVVDEQRITSKPSATSGGPRPTPRRA